MHNENTVSSPATELASRPLKSLPRRRIKRAESPQLPTPIFPTQRTPGAPKSTPGAATQDPRKDAPQAPVASEPSSNPDEATTAEDKVPEPMPADSDPSINTDETAEAESNEGALPNTPKTHKEPRSPTEVTAREACTPSPEAETGHNVPGTNPGEAATVEHKAPEPMPANLDPTFNTEEAVEAQHEVRELSPIERDLRMTEQMCEDEHSLLMTIGPGFHQWAYQHALQCGSIDHAGLANRSLGQLAFVQGLTGWRAETGLSDQQFTDCHHRVNSHAEDLKLLHSTIHWLFANCTGHCVVPLDVQQDDQDLFQPGGAGGLTEDERSDSHWVPQTSKSNVPGTPQNPNPGPPPDTDVLDGYAEAINELRDQNDRALAPIQYINDEQHPDLREVREWNRMSSLRGVMVVPAGLSYEQVAELEAYWQILQDNEEELEKKIKAFVKGWEAEQEAANQRSETFKKGHGSAPPSDAELSGEGQWERLAGRIKELQQVNACTISDLWSRCEDLNHTKTLADMHEKVNKNNQSQWTTLEEGHQVLEEAEALAKMIEDTQKTCQSCMEAL